MMKLLDFWLLHMTLALTYRHKHSRIALDINIIISSVQALTISISKELKFRSFLSLSHAHVLGSSGSRSFTALISFFLPFFSFFLFIFISSSHFHSVSFVPSLSQFNLKMIRYISPQPQYFACENPIKCSTIEINNRQ